MTSERRLSTNNISFILRALSLLHRLLSMLSGWNVLVAFLEASFWHFTEPSTLGLSIWPALGLIAALLAPGFFFLSRRVYDYRPRSLLARLLIATAQPFLLLVASFPGLDERPSARTMTLGAGVFVLPAVLRFARPDRPVEAGCECFLVVYVSMCVRWTAHAVNIFYEEWKLPLYITATSLIVAALRLSLTRIVGDASAAAESAAAPCSNEVLTTTELMETGGSGKIEVDDEDDLSSLPITARSDEEDEEEENRDESSGSSNLYRVTPSEPTTSTRTESAMVLLITPGLSSLVMILVQFFSSPAQLARWAGVRADPFAIFVVFFCTISYALALALRSPHLDHFFLTMATGARNFLLSCWDSKTTTATTSAATAASEPNKRIALLQVTTRFWP